MEMRFLHVVGTMRGIEWKYHAWTALLNQRLRKINKINLTDCSVSQLCMD